MQVCLIYLNYNQDYQLVLKLVPFIIESQKYQEVSDIQSSLIFLKLFSEIAKIEDMKTVLRTKTSLNQVVEKYETTKNEKLR